jgi:nitrogen regulatory protein PII
MQEFELICVIVNCGQGSHVIKAAKQSGIAGATVTIGKGTGQSSILDFIGLLDVRKEIVFMVASRITAYKTLEELNSKFAFEKPNHGIAYTTSVCKVMGTHHIKCEHIKNERGVERMYHAITVIVNKGDGENVIDAATKAGSKGGTIINARGSGIHETSKLFAMDIEPEKEIVIILSKTESTEKIVATIREDVNIDEPGKGIIYIQDINKAYGLYE